MSITKELGKISKVSFGHGGYQEACIGLCVTMEGEGFGVGDFKGAWNPCFIDSKGTKWTEADRDKQLAESVRFICQILKNAKVSDVSQLKGKPVEVMIEDMRLKSWRILTEVL